MEYIIYCRKSSEDSGKQIASIESQQQHLADLAKHHEAVIDYSFLESMSAKQPGRPEFEKMIDLIEHNPGSVIFVWKLDRLARNPVDEGKIKWLLQNKTIARIITPERIYYPEDNALIASVEFGMANQYIRDLSSNVKRGNRTKLEKGELPGPAPIGYLDNKITKQKEIDPVNAPLLKRAFELYATGGYSLKEVSRIFSELGLTTKSGKKLSKALLHHALTNPFYYGVIRRNGQIYSGNHEPIIPKQLFEEVQSVLTGKHHSKKQKHFFALRGFMNCASCGCLLTASKKKGHVYYYCTNGKGNCEQHTKYLREKLADELVAKVFNEIKFDTEAVELAYLASKEKYENHGNQADTLKTELAQQLKTAQDKLSNLAEIVSTDPNMKDALKSKILSLEANIKSLEQSISDLNRQPKQDPLATLEQTKKAFLQACSASFDYKKGDDFKKFELLKILLWNLKIENQSVQCYQLKQPYQLMAESPKNLIISNWLGRKDSDLR